jgi:galactose mutarotase-like enzyme
MDDVTLSNGSLAIAVKPLGAELCSLRLAGEELLWQAGEPWHRHAPVLFPVVGRLAGDTLRHGGHAWPMTQHGFARDRVFALEARDDASCTFVLNDDATTRAVYPFGFRLAITHRLEGDRLVVEYRITNPDAADLFCSLGAHPAFRWPLSPGSSKEAHRIVFDAEEDGPVRGLDGGLLSPEPVSLPIHDRVLMLAEDLFDHDALILERVASSRVRYEAPDGRAIEIGWDGFTALGLWSKPADFVCVEPWSGHADPVGFRGDIADKPGILRIGAGETLARGLSIRPCGPS